MSRLLGRAIELLRSAEASHVGCACHAVVRVLGPSSDRPVPCYGCQHRPCWVCKRDAFVAAAELVHEAQRDGK